MTRSVAGSNSSAMTWGPIRRILSSEISVVFDPIKDVLSNCPTSPQSQPLWREYEEPAVGVLHGAVVQTAELTLAPL